MTKMNLPEINKINYKLYNSDIFKLLPLLKQDSVKYDLLILDPPFDIWNQVLITDWIGLLSENSYLLTFFRQPYTTNILYFFKQYLRFRDELIWYDPQPQWVSNYLSLRVHENILIFQKGNKKSNMFIMEENELYGQKINKGNRKIGKWENNNKQSYTPHKYKMLTSVIKAPKNLQSPLGKWGKPKKLIEYLIKAFSNENDNILDPFAGSGIIGEVCLENKRKYTGIELEKNKIFLIKDRLFHQNKVF